MVTPKVGKPKPKKDSEGPSVSSSTTSTNSFESLASADTQEEEECVSEEEEPQIPLSQVQRLVTQQVQTLMGQWILANQAQQAHSGSTGSKGKDLPALEKLKNFKGETDTDELTLWIEELERHCTYYAVGGSLDTEAKKLAYAVSHLVGGAAAWWKTRQNYIKTYQTFLVALQERFQSVVAEDKAADELYELRQKEGQTVTAFSDRFVQLLVRIPDMHEKDKIRHFKRGLLPTLQQKVREKEVVTLNEAIELAVRLESTFVKKSGGAGGTGKAAINSVSVEGLPAEQLQELINQVKAAWTAKGTPTAPTSSTGPGGVKAFCARCGNKEHKVEACKYPDWVCFFCKKPGHKKQECEAWKLKSKNS